MKHLIIIAALALTACVARPYEPPKHDERPVCRTLAECMGKANEALWN